MDKANEKELVGMTLEEIGFLINKLSEATYRGLHEANIGVNVASTLILAKQECENKQ